MATFIFFFCFLILFIIKTVYINYYLFLVWLITSYILAFLLLIIFYLLNLPVILLLRPTHPYKTYLMKTLATFLNKWFLNLKVTIVGIENIPKTGMLVAYANHKSYTDAFSLLQFFPRPLTLSPKKTVLKIPFLKWWLRAYSVFPIDRNNPKETLKDLEEAIKTVKQGQSILIFPEGTIKNRLNPLVENVKPGAFRLAKKAKAAILPIKFVGNDLVRKRWPFQSRRKIIIFPIIPYENIKDFNTKEIASTFLDIINAKAELL